MKAKIRLWQPAEVFFALLLLLGSVWLLLQLGEQVVYKNGHPFYKQPGLWSSIGLVGMLLFAGLYVLDLWRTKAQRPHSDVGLWEEVWRWCRSLEFLAWFMAYVSLVPILGYLLSTPLFALLLIIRLGYRGRQRYLSALWVALAIVLLFKTLLQVKIPGGQLYEYFPGALRNFLIVYF